jgi:hypothetical protein
VAFGCGTPVLLVIALFQEIGDGAVGLGKDLFVREEDDSEMLRTWALSKSGSMNNQDMLLANEFGDEYIVAFRNIDTRISVESPRGETQLTRGVECTISR